MSSCIHYFDQSHACFSHGFSRILREFLIEMLSGSQRNSSAINHLNRKQYIQIGQERMLRRLNYFFERRTTACVCIGTSTGLFGTVQWILYIWIILRKLFHWNSSSFQF